MDEINNQFWRLQKQCGLTNQQAANYLGLNISTIKRYRNGKLRAPKPVMMVMNELAAKALKTGDEK